MSNENELLLDILTNEEQSAIAALRSAQEKKKQVLLAQQEAIELEELLKRQEYLAILKASPTELKVMGLNYNKLKDGSCTTQYTEAGLRASRCAEVAGNCVT